MNEEARKKPCCVIHRFHDKIIIADVEAFVIYTGKKKIGKDFAE